MVLHCPTSPLLHWLVLSAEGCTLAGSAAHCQVSVVSVIKFRDGCLWSKCQKIFSRRMRCWEKTEPMWPETWTQKHLALAVVAAEPRCPPAPVLHNPYHPPNSQRNIFWSTAGEAECSFEDHHICKHNYCVYVSDISQNTPIVNLMYLLCSIMNPGTDGTGTEKKFKMNWKGVPMGARDNAWVNFIVVGHPQQAPVWWK